MLLVYDAPGRISDEVGMMTMLFVVGYERLFIRFVEMCLLYVEFGRESCNFHYMIYLVKLLPALFHQHVQPNGL